MSRFLEGHGGRLARFAMSCLLCPLFFIFLVDEIRGSLVVFAPTVNDISVDCGSNGSNTSP